MFLPPALTARLIMLGVTTLATTVIPVLLEDRPKLKFIFDKIGPRIVSKVQAEVDERFLPPAQYQHKQTYPMRFDNGVSVEGACINANQAAGDYQVGNPNGYCRQHWWTAGPVRAVTSFPFRVFGALRRWRWL